MNGDDKLASPNENNPPMQFTVGKFSKQVTFDHKQFQKVKSVCECCEEGAEKLLKLANSESLKRPHSQVFQQCQDVCEEFQDKSKVKKFKFSKKDTSSVPPASGNKDQTKTSEKECEYNSQSEKHKVSDEPKQISCDASSSHSNQVSAEENFDDLFDDSLDFLFSEDQPVVKETFTDENQLDSPGELFGGALYDLPEGVSPVKRSKYFEDKE